MAVDLHALLSALARHLIQSPLESGSIKQLNLCDSCDVQCYHHTYRVRYSNVSNELTTCMATVTALFITAITSTLSIQNSINLKQ